MKQNINIWEHAQEIMENVGKGALLTTRVGDEVNSMTIGWGMIGIEWKKPIFIAYVRQSRHTKKLLDANGEFTVNIPVGACDKNILAVCGKESGRDVNKIEKLGLTLIPGETVSVPAIAELPLTLECKVIYQQDQVLEAIEEGCRNRYYAEGTPNDGDFHTAYYGLVTKAYIVE
jgi:flavin reductase (DIM6/NTAB) family NADH-FMN oxidoreductase RutF